LVRSGILRSKRGPRGGYTLARPTTGLTIAEIVRATEGSVETLLNGRDETFRQTVAAQLGTSSSDFRASEEVWGEVVGRVSEVLESSTIDDLVQVAEKLGLEREVSGNMYFI
jgi:DNA-binding IscR family transcriptional regulator